MSSDRVVITTMTMGFKVGVKANGMIKPTTTSIVNYIRPLQYYKRNGMTDQWELSGEFFHFDRQNEICYIPLYDLERFKRYLEANFIRYDVEREAPEEGAAAPFSMLPYVTYKNDKQKNSVDYLTNEESGPLRGLALQTGVGKAQPLDSLILTTDGWIAMGDVVVGTEVITPDGGTASVTGVYPQGEIGIYQVTFEDGRHTECCDDHLWTITNPSLKGEWKTLRLKEIRQAWDTNLAARLTAIPLLEPKEIDDVDLPIHPYLLGVMFGSARIHKQTIRLRTREDWFAQEFAKRLPSEMMIANVNPKGFDLVSGKARQGATQSLFMAWVKRIGSGNPDFRNWSVPRNYAEASPTQKLLFIQGLMDTQGSVGSYGDAHFYTANIELALQLQDMIRSLGGVARINSTVRGTRTVHAVQIHYKHPKDLFSLPGKKNLAPLHNPYGDQWKLRITDIKFVGKKPAQCIMVDHPDHLYITDNYVVTHNTVAFIWALQKLGVRSMTTMTSRLEQWVREMGKYTTLDSDDIYIIQGVGSLTKLFNQIDKELKPKIILASAQTIKLYLNYGPNYQHLPNPGDMCRNLKVGIVGTDEYHEHFGTNFKIGVMLNPKLFIPITATFVANDTFVRNIFDQFIPKRVQFTGGDYEKFVNVTAVNYSGGGWLIKPFHYTSPQGYSQVKLENFLLKKGRKVLEACLSDCIIPLIKEFYINMAEPGEKFLFLCSTQDMCDHLQTIFRREFKNRTTSVFYSGMPENTLERYDMIISTPGSAGTGRDIKGLKTCMVFENTKAEARNLQFIGRLRGPPTFMNQPEFVYVYFGCIPKHREYAQTRAMLYGPRAKTMRQRRM